MRTEYLIRFDDICPTMDWQTWETIEPTLIHCGIRPILAVIPDNQDGSLTVGRYEKDFWERVRSWQSRGWTIGLHGYQHRYVTKNPGLMGRAAQSEFAGVPLAEQQVMLRTAVAIFRSHDVSPHLWIAPGHSFDRNTLIALKQLGIQTISDGFSLFPYLDEAGMLWIPQQFGRFRTMPFGVWTICLHLDDYRGRESSALRRSLETYHSSITSVQEVHRRYGARRKHWIDAGMELLVKQAKRAHLRLHVPRDVEASRC